MAATLHKDTSTIRRWIYANHVPPLAAIVLENLARTRRGHPPMATATHKLIPIEQILKAGCICAYEGCPRTFKGPMPTGWTWLQLYWSPQVNSEPLQRDWMRDGVLCPSHTLKIDALFKRISRVAE